MGRDLGVLDTLMVVVFLYRKTMTRISYRFREMLIGVYAVVNADGDAKAEKGTSHH